MKTSPSQQQRVWKREWWDKFDDVAGYRNTKSEILDGFKLVDEYLVQWMRREFLPSPDDWLFAEDDMVEAERAKRGINRFAEYYLSEAEREKLADIFEALCGIWGILTCYDYVGTDDPATDDVYANWKRIPWPYKGHVPGARDRGWERILEEGRRETPDLFDFRERWFVNHGDIRFYQNLAHLKPEAFLLPEEEYTAIVTKRSNDEEDALVARVYRLRRCGYALMRNPVPAYKLETRRSREGDT